MKDLLNYYYFLLPDRIEKCNNNYYFSFKNYFFAFYKYKGNLEDINSILSLNNYMIFNNKKINKIILNKEGSILTKKDNNYYCLILLEINSKEKINLRNIIEFNRGVSINILNRTNWYFLWIKKIDNIEYMRNHLKNKYKLIYNSLPYYIGLTENAISYLKYLKLDNNHIGICHKRVNASDTLREFYNPLNLVIDYKVRDLAEYYKSLFFSKKMDIKDILDLLKKVKMNNVDYIYFYIRMLYPSYYFDLFDLILNDKISEEKITSITMLQSDYEYLLYEIYLILKSQVNLIGIEWINKKFAF